MYNEELKERFINQAAVSVSTRKKYRTLFDITESIESEEGLDLCCMDAKLIKRCIEKCGIKTESIAQAHALIKNYSKWCIEQEIEGAKYSIRDVYISDLAVNRIKETTVSSPFHLQKCLDEVFAKEDNLEFSLTYRCFLWLAFIGCPEDIAFKLKTTDVILQEMIVKTKIGSETYEFPIYREALKTFKYCSELDYFMSNNPNYKKVYKLPRVSSNQLLRGLKKEATQARFRNEVSKFVRAANTTKLSYSHVFMSGIFYRKYQEELAGMRVDFSDVVGYMTDGKEYVMKSGKDYKNWRKNRQEIYMEMDYDKWKMAFQK